MVFLHSLRGMKPNCLNVLEIRRSSIARYFAQTQEDIASEYFSDILVILSASGVKFQSFTASGVKFQVLPLRE